MMSVVNPQLAATLKALSPVVNVASPANRSSASQSTQDSPVAQEQRRQCAPLAKESIPQKINDVEYAVRGRVVKRSMELKKDIESQPFAKLLPCHIGNPHAVGMKPLTYIRETVSLVACPSLLTKTDDELAVLFHKDNIQRARRYYKALGEPGAYSHSQGSAELREEICDFFERRDGVKPSIDTLFLSNGASDSINTLLTCLVGGASDGIMLPKPQYPLYAACMTKLGGTPVYYELDEEDGWTLGRAELERAYVAATSAGVDVKAIVVIAPGNPAPTMLSTEQVLEILTFARDRNMVCVADEVYQENCYTLEKTFHPFRKVMLENKLETVLASVHSSSKGFYGECGFRAGLIQYENVDREALDLLYKMRSVELCPNTLGQCVMTAVTNPPKPGEESYDLYIQEKTAIMNELKEKSVLTCEYLNSVPGVKCQPISGAMYAFPSIEFSENAIKHASSENMSIELFYCLKLVEQTGIVTTPGDGFGQKEGTHHLRLTILPQLDDLKKALDSFRQFHLDFSAKYN